MIPLWAWGLLLDGFGLLGSWFLSNKSRTGWMISLFTQFLWTVYSVHTKQWGFFPGIAIQSAINIHGFVRWGREPEVVPQEIDEEAQAVVPALERRPQVQLLRLLHGETRRREQEAHD